VGPWGTGLLSVLRTKHDQAQPYIGTVPLLTGHLAKDLTFYWLQSEQVQSAVGIEVFMEHGKIKLAEGFLIQAMPGATDADITFIEDHLKKLHQFDLNASERSSPLNLLSYLLENQSFSLLEEKNISLKCHCSSERVKRSLVLVGSAELKSMLEENRDIEVVCDFCSEKYSFSPQVIADLIHGNGD
jgi:molecular chaperone Hsp33